MMVDHKKRIADDMYRVTIDLAKDEMPTLYYKDIIKGHPIVIQTERITIISSTPVVQMQVVARNMLSTTTSLMEDILNPGRYKSAVDMVISRESKPQRSYPEDGCTLLIYDTIDTLIKRMPIRLLSRSRVFAMTKQMHKRQKVAEELDNLRNTIARLETCGPMFDLASTEEYD